MQRRDLKRHEGLLERARQAREAHLEVQDAFKKIVDRRDEANPATRRWKEAIAQFNRALDRVYPDALREALNGRRKIDDLATIDILDFLEADPLFFGSGYFKPNLLAAVKRRDLESDDRVRLQDVVLNIVRTRDCREFRHYCNAAVHVDDQRLRDQLSGIERGNDDNARRRARWMLDTLERVVRHPIL